MSVRVELTVLTLFAAAWAWIALQFSSVPPFAILLPIGFSLALLASGWRIATLLPAGSAAAGRRVGKLIGLWSAIEIAGIILSANIIQSLHRPDLLFPSAVVIVGLHFFPIARGVPAHRYYFTGAAFLCAGLGGLLVPADQRPLIVGLGAAVFLWLTALAVVLQTSRSMTGRQPVSA